MNNDNNHCSEGTEPTDGPRAFEANLERQLRDALTPPPIPKAWNQNMVDFIRDVPGNRGKTPKRPLHWPIAAALAAAAALLFLTLILRPQDSPVVPSTPVIASPDINQDGAVNILDAFTLAAALKRGETNPAWDINADGLVNESDTRAIATQAVQLTTSPAPIPPAPPTAIGTSS